MKFFTNDKIGEIKEVKFSKAQFFALMKAVYLGNWVANATRTKRTEKEYEELESYIFSHAAEFGFGKYVDDEPAGGREYFPNREFEEGTGVDKLHEEYDNETFWEELAERLGERDFWNKYGKKVIRKMTQEEYFEKLYECIDGWQLELEKVGLDRLGNCAGHPAKTANNE
ncbi:MAG: hypothetical protein Q7S36_00975 [Candidatus Liptonbacteria bacterium]|nr:hypothetical protein [Candidatus Liptonbacteria bacterium]